MTPPSTTENGLLIHLVKREIIVCEETDLSPHPNLCMYFIIQPERKIRFFYVAYLLENNLMTDGVQQHTDYGLYTIICNI